jgi:calcineurin-like phosphoesterase
MYYQWRDLADGKGLTEKVVKPLWDCGVDVITGGNHLWDRVEAIEFIQKKAES